MPRRPIHEELRVITRRGDVFLYCTDDADAAARAAKPMPRLPGGLGRVQVLAVDADPKLDGRFIFETLWYGRNSFVTSHPERAESLLETFIGLLTERRSSRAHTRQAVVLVWDMPKPISETDRQAFAALGQATGFSLLICPRPMPTEKQL